MVARAWRLRDAPVRGGGRMGRCFRGKGVLARGERAWRRPGAGGEGKPCRRVPR